MWVWNFVVTQSENTNDFLLKIHIFQGHLAGSGVWTRKLLI